MKPLTEKQQAVLTFVEDFCERQGYPPTVREVASHFAVQPRAAADHLEALKRKGHLRREPGLSRGLVLSLRGPGQVVEVPVLGRIAAGQPLLAQEQVEDTLPRPGAWSSRGTTRISPPCASPPRRPGRWCRSWERWWACTVAWRREADEGLEPLAGPFEARAGRAPVGRAPAAPGRRGRGLGRGPGRAGLHRGRGQPLRSLPVGAGGPDPGPGPSRSPLPDPGGPGLPFPPTGAAPAGRGGPGADPRRAGAAPGAGEPVL